MNPVAEEDSRKVEEFLDSLSEAGEMLIRYGENPWCIVPTEIVEPEDDAAPEGEEVDADLSEAFGRLFMDFDVPTRIELMATPGGDYVARLFGVEHAMDTLAVLPSTIALLIERGSLRARAREAMAAAIERRPTREEAFTALDAAISVMREVGPTGELLETLNKLELLIKPLH